MGANKTVAALVEYFQTTYAMPQKQAEARRKNRTVAMMKDDGKRFATGEAFYVTVKQAGGGSASHDFATGMEDEGASVAFRWLVEEPKTIYGRLTFDARFLKQNPLGAIIDVKGAEMDDQVQHMLDRLEKKLWSDQYDDLGRGLSRTGTSTEYVYTLENDEDVYNFDLNKIVEGFADRDTLATAPFVDKYKVTKRDPANGKITLTRVSGTNDDLTATAYFFVRGDRNSTAGGLSFPGITAFIPSTDPTTTLLGVARDGHGAERSGWRFPYKGTITQTIKKSFSVMGRYVNRPGARFTVCLSVGDWYRLENELGTDVIRNPNAQQLFGTDSIGVRTHWGVVDCISIPVLRDGRMYYMDWSTWTLHHLGGMPHIIDDDGQTVVRLHPGSPTGNSRNGDGVEMRWRMWVHPVCEFPYANGTAPTVA